MKLGISVTHHAAPGESIADRLTEVLRQVQLADDAGFDSVSFGHHYLTRSSFLQPIPLASYLAARTSNVELVLGVYLLPLQAPIAVAEELLTLDAMSNGRLVAGFGSGYRRSEFLAVGVPFQERYRRLEENVIIVKDLFTGRPVSGDFASGSLNEAQVLLRPVREEGLPVWLGGFSPAGARRAARLGVSWLAAPSGDVQQLAALRAEFVAERDRLDMNTPITFPILREGFVASTHGHARSVARPHLASQYREYRSWDHGEDIDHLLDHAAIVGDPNHVLERIIELGEAGFDHVMLRMEWPGMDPSDVLRSIELLADVITDIHRIVPQTKGPQR